MARIRTYKPEFWTDSKTGQLTGDATKLFLGLLSFADDYGVIKLDCQEFKVRIFPYDSRILANVLEASLLLEVVSRGLVRSFQCSGEQYLHIVNFPKHQKVDHPGLPILPSWTKTTTIESYQRLIGESVELTQTNQPYIKDSVANPREDSRTLAPDCKGLDSNKELSSNERKDKQVEITYLPDEGDRPHPPKKVLEIVEPKPDLKAAIRTRVWPAYLELTNRTEKEYSWTPVRAVKAEARLKEFFLKTDGDLDKAIALMLRVVEAIGKSDWHMGRDVKSNGKRYVEWEEHLWRSREQAEKWLAESKARAPASETNVWEETMRQRGRL